MYLYLLRLSVWVSFVYKTGQAGEIGTWYLKIPHYVPMYLYIYVILTETDLRSGQMQISKNVKPESKAPTEN